MKYIISKIVNNISIHNINISQILTTEVIMYILLINK